MIKLRTLRGGYPALSRWALNVIPYIHPPKRGQREGHLHTEEGSNVVMKLEIGLVQPQVEECGQPLEEEAKTDSPLQLLERVWSCPHIDFGTVKL